MLLLVLHVTSALVGLTQSCSLPGWNSHQLSVDAVSPNSVINITNLPLNKSLYGVEGGHALLLNDTLYIALAEFTAPPHFVPSNIALWRAKFDFSTNPFTWPTEWTRLRTLYRSEGRVLCDSYRASLGSSVALAFNNDTNHFEIFYVGFKSCNDSKFVNRYGRIFRGVSDVPGYSHGGIEGPYTDVSVVLQPAFPVYTA